MTVSKSILTISTLAFAMMFGGGVYILMHLNTLAKPVIERMATQSLGVPVSIGGLEISLQDKMAVADDIRIGNPDGFLKPYAMTVGQAQVALETFGERNVDLKGIQATDTHVYVEVKGNTTNLHTLQKGIKGGDSGTSSEDPFKVIVRRFAAQTSVIHPSVTLLESQDLDPIELSPIVLTDIGTRENGILARDAIAQIMRPLIRQYSREAAQAGFYEGLSSEALKELGVSQVDQIRSRVGEEVEKFGGEIQKLFGSE